LELEVHQKKETYQLGSPLYKVHEYKNKDKDIKLHVKPKREVLAIDLIYELRKEVKRNGPLLEIISEGALRSLNRFVKQSQLATCRNILTLYERNRFIYALEDGREYPHAHIVARNAMVAIHDEELKSEIMALRYQRVIVDRLVLLTCRGRIYVEELVELVHIHGYQARVIVVPLDEKFSVARVLHLRDALCKSRDEDLWRH